MGVLWLLLEFSWTRLRQSVRRADFGRNVQSDQQHSGLLLVLPPSRARPAASGFRVRSVNGPFPKVLEGNDQQRTACFHHHRAWR
jgi:hypothetical protein